MKTKEDFEKLKKAAISICPENVHRIVEKTRDEIELIDFFANIYEGCNVLTIDALVNQRNILFSLLSLYSENKSAAGLVDIIDQIKNFVGNLDALRKDLSAILDKAAKASEKTSPLITEGHIYGVPLDTFLNPEKMKKASIPQDYLVKIRALCLNQNFYSHFYEDYQPYTLPELDSDKIREELTLDEVKQHFKDRDIPRIMVNAQHWLAARTNTPIEKIDIVARTILDDMDLELYAKEQEASG